MNIVVCVKEVLDPDAVNNYALAGRLVVGPDGKSFAQAGIPRLMNAYDEQALEAALRLRDAGLAGSIRAVSVGRDLTGVLRHAAALGADEVAAIAVEEELDAHGVALLLARYVQWVGGADLVLCGRQASDDDQGVVPALLAEALGMPLITVAREVRAREEAGRFAVRVVRVTPEGDEVVEAAAPVVVTVSSELGPPRYPTAARKMAVRRLQPKAVSLADLSVTRESLAPRVRLVRQFVPEVQGHCEFLSGSTADEIAAELLARLRADGALPPGGGGLQRGA